MIRKTALFFILLFSLQIVKAQPTNTNLSNGLVFNGEPYLAVNPTNSQNIIAAWMGYVLYGSQFRVAIKTRASFNGGNTWSAANILPHFGVGFGSADVSMAFSKTGLLFLSYIDYKESPDSGGIYVTRSLNGGLSWNAPTKVFDMYDVANKRPIDRPWLVVDNSNTSNAGTLYITTKPAPWINPPNRNYFKVSSDSGYTWTPIANVDGGSYLVGNLIAQPLAAPATTKDGKFCAIYPSYVASQNPLPAYYFASSNNKGQTFSYATVLAAIVAPLNPNLKLSYRFMANPIDSSKMIFLLPNANNGDADIMALHSNDAGQTWSSNIRVNDDVIGNGKEQDMVWAAYNQQGNLVVTWRDRRNAGVNGFTNAGYDFYYATSTDNGQTFSANQKLSSQFIPFDSIISQNGNDVMNCAYVGDTLYATWGDTRNGKMNIYFAKTIVSTNTNIEVTKLDGEASQWTAYPNPTSDYLNIELGKEKKGKTILIYDAHGKEIASQKISDVSMRIKMQNLSKGIYFISIENEVKKIIKK
jgi:Secretion system C-terminal sorting domain/BNR repeat-like domain